MKPPDGEYPERIAGGFVLAAGIGSSRAFQRAFVIATRSACAGAPGVTVTVVVRVTPNHVAVIVTVVVAARGDVVTANAPLEAPPLTKVSSGTCRTAGLLLDRSTTAPS